MNDYLIDRETLEKVLDEIMKKGPAPVGSAEELYAWREEKMKELDDKVSEAVFGSLNEEQLTEVNRLVDNGELTEANLMGIFEKAGVNLDAVVKRVLQEFSEEVMGGKNE